MAEKLELNHPCLVAVWPGMGGVALTAGYYLLAKFEMHVIAEVEARDLFDVESVEVKHGLIQSGRRPRNRFFLWVDPEKKRDLVLLLGEAQPPIGKYMFCHRLIEAARDMGVERIFTFAAMATQMTPRQPSRVFGAATDRKTLDELRPLDLEILQDGNVGGLNGVLLGAAAEQGVHGACLLGEMPHIFAQLPFPKASLAILEVFTTLTGLELDFAELSEQAQTMEEQLSDLLSRVQQSYTQGESQEETSSESQPEEQRLSDADARRLESLFREAAKDRSKAFELKRELDRLGTFKEYEDRFLDLFKKPGGE
jgi:proteasome assembly chaperone (PAC2) family protein